ncbi:carbon-nitrogen hydrolase family protein [uncultured Methanospirillum sp.]|uniref:carbon-nitrogen hydrolase family protein n=1 Tax=uncultured Methanospirillum sp. TaxID=262503 RepID=UPI0029C8EBBD|nr:carbon-nitrogen hydrolase family protein [uncultured Methanospirillum sp.]
MILCTAQISPCWQNPNCTLSSIKNRIAEAMECDASFISFPEQVITGWDPLDGKNFVQTEEDEIISVLKEYARDFGIGLLGSYREMHHPCPRNTAIAIGPDGHLIARYSKMHLFSPEHENQAYTPGEEIALFSYDGCRCGIAICYDLRFADLFRLYRDGGADLMLVPSAWPASRMRHFELFITARAAEFQMYIAGINTVGETPVDRYAGGSLVAGPDGTVLSRGSEVEELLFTEISPDHVVEVRDGFSVHHDRRNKLYQNLS